MRRSTVSTRVSRAAARCSRSRPDEAAAEQAAARLERVFGFVNASSACAASATRGGSPTRPGAFERQRPGTSRCACAGATSPSRSPPSSSSARSGPRSRRAPRCRWTCGDPDLELRVELDRDYAYVHVRELTGAGGLPVGTSGRAVSLLSGGIDSPVAALLAMKRGLSVEFLHFSGEPYLDPMATTKAQAQARC